jgi:hypothetical protein
MLNAFPQGNANPDLTMATFEASLGSASSAAVIEAAQRFTAGDIPGQSRTFAPSVAEFTQEARKVEEAIQLRNRPRLPPPSYRRGPLAPFEVGKQKALAANAHLPVLFEDVSYDQFRRLSSEGQIPAGGKWVAALATVYGPPA